MELQEALHLPDYPSRIECYDISHFQGSQTVASMVVFTDGVPDKDAYRRFKIHVAEGKPDDFKSMLEVISRRFKHSKAGDEGWNDPDLVIIDGGKGQLSSAVKALHEVGVSDQPIVSLAKRMEEVFIPGQEHSILLPRDSTALFLLQQIRDEAHRFAITYHRTLRAKATTKTDLDTIPGLGPKRKQKLLDHYGTLASMRQAPLEEIARVLGLSVDKAQPIYDALLASAS
jgi:excinuclease ABC subunit C